MINKNSGSVHYSFFSAKDGYSELHAVFKPGIGEQGKCMEKIRSDYRSMLDDLGTTDGTLFFARFYAGRDVIGSPSFRTSDLFNEISGYGHSVVEQEPLDQSSVVLYVYHIIPSTGGALKREPSSGNESFIRGENYDLLFSGNIKGSGKDAFSQTIDIFNRYKRSLDSKRMVFSRDLIRSWIYVGDIDNNYGAMLEARKKFFFDNNINEKGIFPASTGIGCFLSDPEFVKADFLSIGRLSPGQVNRMECRSMPSPYSYGVTFERGLHVKFGDRSHLHISGTASIDRNGSIMYENNIEDQSKKTIENIKDLLEAHGAGLQDIAQMNVFIREKSLAARVEKIIDAEFSGRTPYLILNGPVCRPGWLVEMDGTVILTATNDLPDFK